MAATFTLFIYFLFFLFFRLNERILSENAVYLDLTGNTSSTDSVSEYEKLSVREKTGTLLKNMKYFTEKVGQSKKPDLITHWIVADLDAPIGRNMLKCALDQMVKTFLRMLLPPPPPFLIYTLRDLNCFQ